MRSILSGLYLSIAFLLSVLLGLSGCHYGYQVVYGGVYHPGYGRWVVIPAGQCRPPLRPRYRRSTMESANGYAEVVPISIPPSVHPPDRAPNIDPNPNIESSCDDIIERSAQLMSKDYEIRVESARRILKQNPEDWTRLGVNPADLQLLTQFKLPSSDSVKQIADALGEPLPNVDRLIRDFVADIKHHTQKMIGPPRREL